MKLGIHYVWFKLALAFGSLLGLWLLGQSIVTYYLVSQNIIREELRREAGRQVSTLQEEANIQNINIRTSDNLTPLLTQAIADAPKKIAWIRIVDRESGRIVAQAGKPVGTPLPLPVPQDRPGGAPSGAAPGPA
jgi:hypothetical protein